MQKIACFISLVCAVSLFAAQTDRVRVAKRTAITKPFTQKVEVGQECYDDTVEMNVNCGNADTNSIGIDTIIGATAGVALGNQIGRGTGKDVARVIGGLVGGVTANNMRENKACKTYETVRRCNPKYEYKTIYKNIGYNNCAYYNGEEICVQTKEPIDYIRVEKSISIFAD